ncbi:MAG: proline--tRNA ligase [Myxococcota bacterium]
MRLSQMFIPTRKEDPAEADVVSHKLLVRGGFIRMLARGIYDYLPLAQRSLRKIEQIIREEMNRAGAQEVLLPSVQPAELWEESGRWEAYGSELLRFKDRKGSEFCYGPTHEEVITDLVRGDVNSYKQLPLNLYQIQTKFRDEPRPRFGLMRGREFIMKDAYSFDIDEEGARKSYDVMFEAYQHICDRLGFDYVAVEADTGNIGGSLSHEFQVLAETGEDEVVSCSECGYAANVEKAEMQFDDELGPLDDELGELEQVDTPHKRTIDEISEFLDVEPARCIKTLIYKVDDEPFAVLMRGDHSANELKIRTFVQEHTELGDGEIRMASDSEVGSIIRAQVGYAGPVELDIPIFADLAVEPMTNVVTGANETNAHLINVNPGRDFEVDSFSDFRAAQEGDLCGRCGGEFEMFRGIEVGHVFYLGTKYSEALAASVQDENGELRPMEMGCYGLGVTRILAATVEQNHDDDGIIWPINIAPYEVAILPLQVDHDGVREACESLYDELQDAGVEVVIDDRDIGVGPKFKDADLVGVPVRVALGTRGLDGGGFELKLRHESDRSDLAFEGAADEILRIIGELKNA